MYLMTLSPNETFDPPRSEITLHVSYADTVTNKIKILYYILKCRWIKKND